MSVIVADNQTRAKILQFIKFASVKSFLKERNDFVSITLIDFEPIERFENRRDKIEPGCFRAGLSCKV